MIKRLWLVFLILMFALFLTSCREEGILIVDSTTPGGSTGDSMNGDALSGEESSGGTTERAVLLVHICGAVNSPGVYELEVGDRIYRLVELAGGFAEDAAAGYLNLAGILSDGQKIVVPTRGEAADDPYGEEAIPDKNGEGVDSALVNINTADKARLMTLPGIGEAKALAIIEWRAEHGRFQTTEDIMLVSGIKEAAYEKIKTLITVD